jgi:hypothetical protein
MQTAQLGQQHKPHTRHCSWRKFTFNLALEFESPPEIGPFRTSQGGGTGLDRQPCQSLMTWGPCHDQQKKDHSLSPSITQPAPVQPRSRRDRPYRVGFEMSLIASRCSRPMRRAGKRKKQRALSEDTVAAPFPPSLKAHGLT